MQTSFRASPLQFALEFINLQAQLTNGLNQGSFSIKKISIILKAGTAVLYMTNRDQYCTNVPRQGRPIEDLNRTVHRKDQGHSQHSTHCVNTGQRCLNIQDDPFPCTCFLKAFGCTPQIKPMDYKAYFIYTKGVLNMREYKEYKHASIPEWSCCYNARFDICMNTQNHSVHHTNIIEKSIPHAAQHVVSLWFVSGNWNGNADYICQRQKARCSLMLGKIPR